MAHGEVGIILVDRPPDPTINAHGLPRSALLRNWNPS
jgi:hypothetical protein